MYNSRGGGYSLRYRFLFENSMFESNPYRASWLLNPLYEILPRGKWLLDSNICQAPADFKSGPTVDLVQIEYRLGGYFS